MSGQTTTCPDTDYPTTDAPDDTLGLRRVEIRAGATSTEVKLDGKRWKGLRSLSLTIAPKNHVVVHATFYAVVDGVLDGLTLGDMTMYRNPAADDAGDTGDQPG